MCLIKFNLASTLLTTSISKSIVLIDITFGLRTIYIEKERRDLKM